MSLYLCNNDRGQFKEACVKPWTVTINPLLLAEFNMDLGPIGMHVSIWFNDNGMTMLDNSM